MLPTLVLLAQLAVSGPTDYAKRVMQALPAWEADGLAIYEQPELQQIKLDLMNGVEDKQLQQDWDALKSLDNHLQIEWLI